MSIEELTAERDHWKKRADELWASRNEAVEYTEAVDAMLDGIIPTRKDSKDPTSQQLWLKERVQMLIDQNEATADKLSDCWLFLDAIARSPNLGDQNNPMVEHARELLKKQQCPGWKS